MVFAGARGTLIYEKNLKSKFSCQTPFKVGSRIRDKLAAHLTMCHQIQGAEWVGGADLDTNLIPMGVFLTISMCAWVSGTTYILWSCQGRGNMQCILADAATHYVYNAQMISPLYLPLIYAAFSCMASQNRSPAPDLNIQGDGGCSYT